MRQREFTAEDTEEKNFSFTNSSVNSVVAAFQKKFL
jgi:hypothetical protein